MAFPVSAVIDNFNRANGGVGANWGDIFAVGGGSNLWITGNQLSDFTTPTLGQWTTDFGPDCETYITHTSTLAPFEPDQELPSDYFILYARLANMGAGTTDGYAVKIDGDDVGTFYRYDNSAPTQLGATVLVTGLLAVGTKWGMSIVGNIISLYYKLAAGSWTLVTTRTDATYTAAGRSGLLLSTSQNNVMLDDFGGGTISSFVAPQGKPSLIRYPSHLLPATEVSTVLLSRKPALTESVTASGVPSVLKSFLHTYSIVATNTTALLKIPQKVLTAAPPSGGSFPTTSVLDDFNRANSGTLGANWTKNIFGWSSTDIKLDTNRAYPDALNATLTAWWNPAQFGADCEAYVTYPSGAAGFDDGDLQWETDVLLYFRIQSPGSAAADGYAFASYDVGSAGGGFPGAAFYRIDNGVLTLLGAAYPAATVAVGEKRGISIVGNTMSWYYNTTGTWVSGGTDRTDSTYAAAGYIGIGANRTNVNAPVPTMDDFGGGTVVTTRVIGIATVLKTPIKLLTATATDTATLLRSAGHVLIVAASGIATILRAPVKLLAATATNTVTFIRDAAIALEAVATGVADLVTQVFAIVYTTLAATSTGVATLTRTAGTTITAVSGNSVAFLVSLPSVLFSVAGSGVATVSRTAFKVLSVAGTGIATLQLALSRILAALATPVGVLTSTASGTLTALGNAVSVLLSGPQTVLSALGTGVATIKRDAIAVLSAAATSVGALLTTKALTTSLTAVGVGVTSLIRDVATTFASLGSGVASLVRHPQIAFNAVASNAATILFSSVKVLSALGTGAVDLIRSSGRILSVAAVSVSALLRSASSTLALSASGIATAVRTPLVILYASASSAASLATEILVSLYYVTLATVGNGIATLQRVPAVTLSVTSTAVSLLVRAATSTLSTVGNGIAVVTKTTTQSLIAIGVGIATLVKQPARVLNVISTTVPRLTKRVQRAFITLVGVGNATLIKTPKRTLQTLGTGTAYLQRVSTKVLRGTISGIVTVRRLPSRTLSTASSGVAVIGSGFSALLHATGTGLAYINNSLRQTLSTIINTVSSVSSLVRPFVDYALEAFMYTKWKMEATRHLTTEMFARWSSIKFNVFRSFYVREWWRRWKG